METTFESLCEPIGSPIPLPKFSGLRIMMMPILIGGGHTIPGFLKGWRSVLSALFALDMQKHGNRDNGKVGYLTIDEKEVQAGATHRRAGLHVDGMLNGELRGKWSGGSWGSTGMLTVSNIVGCRAWNQKFKGFPVRDGECDHLRPQLKEESMVVFDPGQVYWCDPLCVHESIPQPRGVQRQFVRLSLPSDSPWFEGYTENPCGVKPTGEILPRRKYMDA